MNATVEKQNLDKLRRSYSRISKKSTFYDEFYEGLIQNVEVSKHFEGVGKARRSFFLKTSLPTLVMNAMGNHVAEKRMSFLAEKHA